MAEPVRARQLADEEGRRLQQIVRRGKHGSIRVRRAMIIMASASGTRVPAIAAAHPGKTQGSPARPARPAPCLCQSARLRGIAGQGSRATSTVSSCCEPKLVTSSWPSGSSAISRGCPPTLR
jgi:hypothetical protein